MLGQGGRGSRPCTFYGPCGLPLLSTTQHDQSPDVDLRPVALRAVVSLRRAVADGAFHEEAFRWRAEWDRKGYLGFSPISSAAREALEAYLRRRPTIGKGWIFPANEDPAKALDKQMAAYYLRRAEKAAGLTKQEFGGWHSFRRAWATRRKDLPVQDVMAGGGWRDVKALQEAYQAADPETVRRVMEVG
jgi:integrase